MATKVLKNIPVDVKFNVNVIGSYKALSEESIVYTLTSSAEGADPVVLTPASYGVDGNGPFVWFYLDSSYLTVVGDYTLASTKDSDAQTLTLCTVVNSGADTIYPSEIGGHTCGQLNVSAVFGGAGGGSQITIDTTIPATPSDSNVPSTKLFADTVGNIETLLSNI